MPGRRVAALLRRKRGVLLDVSLGGIQSNRSVTLRPGGDVDHDPRRLPWPLPTGSVHTAMVTHVLEYLDPAQVFRWFDELHRVLRPHGVAYFSGPYGGDESQGWLSDPEHRVRVVEQTFSWLDPRLPFHALHGSLGRRTPRPWHTQAVARVPGAHGTSSYNAVMEAQPRRGRA